MEEARFVGGLLGLALGDAHGAPFEGGPLERWLWRRIGRTPQGLRRWTDDTQMALDLAGCLVAHGAVDQDDLAARFARSYRWDRGYGPGAAKLLKRIASGASWQEANRSVYPSGSWGNGGAMRAPVLGLYYARDERGLFEAVMAATEVTHAHPLAVEGAILVAATTASAAQGASAAEAFAYARRCVRQPAFRYRMEVAEGWLGSGLRLHPRQVAAHLGNGITAETSCVTAIYLALANFRAPFTQLLEDARGCRGDVDTLGAMAGAIWGAANGAGALPARLVAETEEAERIAEAARALHQRAGYLAAPFAKVPVERPGTSTTVPAQAGT